MSTPTVSRAQVIAFRWQAQQLDRDQSAGTSPGDAAVLDLGVQDTGTGGAAWALEIRGAPPGGPDDLAFAWTIRGAPHAYRRDDLTAVARATAPLSEVDAGKRIFDANKPLRAAGIAALDALATVAVLERDLVTAPTVKGDLSTALTAVLEQPYLRRCRPCGTTHAYEMPFRLAALQGGLELDAGTSPPVVRRSPGLEPGRFARLGGDADRRFGVVRNYLRFFGPARPREVAAFLDAPIGAVKQHWPDDAIEVAVPELDRNARPQPRYALAGDVDVLSAGVPAPAGTVRLVGPYDTYLQLRDRATLVADEARRADLWRVLGRPGAVLADGEVVGTWRPRKSGATVRLVLEPWARFARARADAVAEQAERYAAAQGATFAGLAD